MAAWTIVVAAAAARSPALLRAGQPRGVLPPHHLRSASASHAHLRSSPAAMLLVDEVEDIVDDPSLSMSPVKIHDLFNLAATTALTGLTCSSLISSSSWNEPLATLMVLYLAVDSIWLVTQPEIAGSGGEGTSSTSSSGGALTLLSHHVFALVVSVHALTWAPHTHYTCQMTVVEINTLVLMLERQLPDGAPLAPFVNKLFVASWVILRLLWFPYLAAQLALLADYPSEAVHLCCATALFALTVHQLLWTWNFCVPEKRWVPLP